VASPTEPNARDDRPAGVSVVVPCRNAATTAGDQLAALAAQEHAGDWELVVADNGSRDGTLDLVRSWGARLPALRVVDARARPGAAHARNAGAAAARFDRLLFCDADDVVAPGWITAMERALRTDDFVASRYETRRLNPRWIQAARENPQDRGLNPYTYPPFLPHAGGGGLGVLRRIHRSIGGFDEELAALEDTDYCWRLQLAGTPLVFVPDAVVHVRFRHDLAGTFRQGVVYGRSNVQIYQRYRQRGMPRLPPLAGLGKWASLALKTPRLVTRAGRVRWLWDLGWRLGRLDGCVRYRVWAP
jgi:GT2 family glycosyltransferase